MDRRRMLGVVGALALTTVIGGATAMKTKAAKAAARCGDIGYCGAACCDVCCGPDCCGDCCCCNSTPNKAPRAKAVEAESCCDEDAQDGKAAKPSQCPATATKG